MCHSRFEEARKYFCPFWNGYDSGQAAESAGYRKTTRTRKRWSEEERTTNVFGKDYDTERHLFGGKWISRPLRCVHRGNFYWFSVRLDSQRSFHTHTSPSPLSPTLFHLLPPIVLSRLEVLSPSVRRYLGRNSFLRRCPYLTRPTPDLLFLLSLLFFYLCSYFLSIFRRRSTRWARVEDRSKTRTMNIK